MIAPRRIPYNRPKLRGNELIYIRQALEKGHLAGGGTFTRRVEDLLESYTGSPKALLTQSCTAALEIAALLLVKPGDEIILPSFTFAATATSFARSGATLVFVDIDPDTLNIDPEAVRAALTPRTRAIVAVHYAGVACDIGSLETMARSANVAFIEDAAHAFGATYRDRPLGTFGDLSAFSFHETKNVISGVGGALIVNDPQLLERAQVARTVGPTGHASCANRWIAILGSTMARPMNHRN
jgi:dTDP-4-amino-4,6-dideoxygalactose transaminase